MIALASVLVIALFLGALWLFSVNEYKAPPSRVVPVPAGFEVLGDRSDGGSGGTTTRWVFIEPPPGVTPERGIDQLEEAMLAAGWEIPVLDDQACTVCPGTFGLVRRDDEWAAFESGESISPRLYDFLDLEAIEDAEVGLIIVRLEYSDWGVGRRQLVD